MSKLIPKTEGDFKLLSACGADRFSAANTPKSSHREVEIRFADRHQNKTFRISSSQGDSPGPAGISHNAVVFNRHGQFSGCLEFGNLNALSGYISGNSKPQSIWREFAMKKFMVRLWKEEEGQDLVEYGLLLVLIALGAIASMGALSKAVSNVFSNAAVNLTTAS